MRDTCAPPNERLSSWPPYSRANGTPCAADFNQDGGVDGADVQAFFLAWQAGNSNADTNQDGGVDGADVQAFFIPWQNGGC